MARAEHRQPLKVEVPKEDSVRLGRVGIIAIVGFLIGIAWPRLAGITLAPSAPVEEEDEVAAEPVASQAASVQAPKLAKAKPAEPPKERPLDKQIKIGEALVTSCRDAQRNKQSDCDKIEFGEVSEDRILALVGCEAAKNVRGTFSIGFDLDFAKDKVVEITSGKSTSLDGRTTRALLKCARDEFQSASLKDIEHRYNEYSVYHLVEFQPDPEPEQAAAVAEEDVIAASGRATVSWQVALIRKAPKDGDVVARLLSGTNVVVTGRTGDWYRVTYDAKDNQGWVYKSAIGL